MSREEACPCPGSPAGGSTEARSQGALRRGNWTRGGLLLGPPLGTPQKQGALGRARLPSLRLRVSAWAPGAGREGEQAHLVLPSHSQPRLQCPLRAPPPRKALPQLRLLFFVLLLPLVPSRVCKKPTWGLTLTLRSLAMDTVVSGASWFQGPPPRPRLGGSAGVSVSGDRPPRGPHFCFEVRMFPSSMLCSWCL